MYNIIKYLRTIVVVAVLGVGAAPQADAFVAFPPITTFSFAMVFLHFAAFALCFSGSVIFQGWHMKRRLGVGFGECTLQAFKVKALFMVCALPILVLSDILGITTILVIERLPLPQSVQANHIFWAIAYFGAGLFVLTSMASLIETHLLSRKWEEIPSRRIRSAVISANIPIFTFALLSMMLVNEMAV